MAIETIPLSRLEANLQTTLNECADSGRPILIELPDRRLLTIQAFEAQDDDLTSELLESNEAFRALTAKSAASERRPFVPNVQAP